MAAKWCGIRTIAFCEIDPFCQKVLRKNFGKDIYIHDDIKTFNWTGASPFMVAGGDPCPCRSKARSIWESKHPNLSGYFLAVVARCRPQWVVRENVPASDDKDFCAALDAIGYRNVIISTNAIAFTAQNRRRDFIIGSDGSDKLRQFCQLPIFSRNLRASESIGEKAPACFCLTTHRQRYDSRDNYVWESGRLRVLDSEERRRFSGFPDGWLTEISKTRIAKMYGNTVVPQIAFAIMQAILEVERENA